MSALIQAARTAQDDIGWTDTRDSTAMGQVLLGLARVVVDLAVQVERLRGLVEPEPVAPPEYNDDDEDVPMRDSHGRPNTSSGGPL